MKNQIENPIEGIDFNVEPVKEKSHRSETLLGVIMLISVIGFSLMMFLNGGESSQAVASNDPSRKQIEINAQIDISGQIQAEIEKLQRQIDDIQVQKKAVEIALDNSKNHTNRIASGEESEAREFPSLQYLSQAKNDLAFTVPKP